MKLEYYPVEKLKQEVRDVIKKYPALEGYRVFFFGSRVSGKGTSRSDIDVGIEGPNEVPSSAMISIKEDIEKLPILYKIDVVDFKAASDDFREVALQYIEPINAP